MLKRDYGGGALEAPTTCGEVENARRLAHTWAARILDLMGRPARNARFNEDAFVELGLVEEKHSDPGVNDVLSDRTRIQALRRELEARDWDGDGQLARNLAFLASCFRLTEPECAVIAFLAICWRFGWLRELVEDASRYSRLGSPANCAAAATGISEQGAYAALSREGRLVQCGLLESKFRTSVDPTDLPHLDDEIRLWIWHPEFGEGFLERQYVRRPVVVDDPEAKTDRMPADLECIRKIVQSMLDGRTAAGQILIHGKAGTGKTRFARQLAESLDADQFEVLESRLGFHLGAVERLRCFRAAQELFRERERCMLVFDEADQVLAGSTGFRSLYSTDWDKAWLNSVLERAVVPGIWIANDIEAVHASTLRRFSMIAEMPDMTESVRSEILRQKIKDLPVGHDWIRQTAKSRSVTPALMERAARVGHALRTAPGEEIEAAMSQTLEGHCRAAGGRFDPPKTAGRNEFDLPYSIEWLNTQPESEPVFDNMTVAREAEGRLLLHGPPGTGKTRFARELAERSDRPLQVVCASDLLDAYVGETEKNIRSVFENAARHKQVILLDEVDSLLADRRNAVRNWEVSQVNELLTRIDGFEGLLLAATNRLEMIDSAVLRRFDIKMRFDYLRPAHALEMLQALVGEDVEIDRPLRERLAGLARLTPGDFRTVVRRHRITGTKPTLASLIEALVEEVAGKPGKNRRPIGFTATLVDARNPL